LKRVQRFPISGREIFHPADIFQPGMFRAYAGIIEARGNRMGFLHLAFRILQQIGTRAMQHARRALRDRGGMTQRIHALACRFDAVDIHTSIVKERMKHADGVRAAADTGDNQIRQFPFLSQHLRAGFIADDSLKVAHQGRIGMRTYHRADDVECVLDIGDPIAQRLVRSVFQGARAGGDRPDFRAQQMHAKNIGLLALGIQLAHIDHTGKAEARRHRRRRHAMLPGSGFRNDAAFSHPPR
jgi:hypothetical protein